MSSEALVRNLAAPPKGDAHKAVVSHKDPGHGAQWDLACAG